MDSDSNTKLSSSFFGHFLPLGGPPADRLLTLLAVVELAYRTVTFHNVGHSRGVILALTVAAAITSVTFGLMLSSGENYDPDLLSWHKWLGIGLAVACILTGLAYWRKKHLLYSGLLMVTLAIMGPASYRWFHDPRQRLPHRIRPPVESARRWAKTRPLLPRSKKSPIPNRPSSLPTWSNPSSSKIASVAAEKQR